MDNHVSSSVAMSQINVTVLEGKNMTMENAEPKCPDLRMEESRHRILTKWRTVIFSLGMLNCLIGIFIFPLSITFLTLCERSFNPYADQYPKLLVAAHIAKDLGSFSSFGLNSSMMLVMCGMSGIATGWKSSTIKVFPSLLLSGVAALSSVGGFGRNIHEVMFSTVPNEAYMSYVADPIGYDGFNMLIALAILCLAGAAASVTQCVFSFRSLYLCITPLEREITDCDNDKMTLQSHLTVIATSRFDTKYPLPKSKQTNLRFIGIAEIIFGLVIVGVEATSFVITDKSIGDMPPSNIGYDQDEINEQARWPLSIHCAGLWGGLVVCVSGALGVSLSVRSSVGMLNANMAMSMIAASTSCLVNFVAVFSIEWRFVLPKYHISVAALSAASFLICVAHAALCCRSQCSALEFSVPIPPVPPGTANTAYVQTGVTRDGLPISGSSKA